LFNIEMISPASEFETVITHFRSKRSEFFERKIGPLAGEKCDWT
jgi:hypothetical protein